MVYGKVSYEQYMVILKEKTSQTTENDPEVKRFALKGLLTDDEIEATISRLKRNKKSITKQKKDEEDPSRFIENDQWNDDTAKALINKNGGEFWHSKEASRNFVDATILQQN